MKEAPEMANLLTNEDPFPFFYGAFSYVLSFTSKITYFSLGSIGLSRLVYSTIGYLTL
jgi:hypothetical protein